VKKDVQFFIYNNVVYELQKFTEPDIGLTVLKTEVHNPKKAITFPWFVNIKGKLILILSFEQELLLCLISQEKLQGSMNFLLTVFHNFTATMQEKETPKNIIGRRINISMKLFKNKKPKQKQVRVTKCKNKQ
jgi:hypothetical protein